VGLPAIVVSVLVIVALWLADTGTGSRSKARPSVVLPFDDIIAQMEAITSSLGATHDDLVRAENLVESINKRDVGNKNCNTGSFCGSGTASNASRSGVDTRGSDSGSNVNRNKKGK
jgi:hypothetical protein